MNNKIRNFVIIMVIIIVAILAYMIGVYAKNVIVNSESEISAEVSESESEIKSEIPCTPCLSTSSAIRKASIIDVFFSQF